MRTFLMALCTLLTMGCASIARAELTGQSSIDDVLDALDKRGQGLVSFTADVKLAESDTATGDASTRSGKVWFQAGESSRIRVTFDKKQVNNKITDDKIEYLLSGPDLIDRNYARKTQVTRHVLKPGEKMNLLKLGEGPFPLPIGQKKEDVHAMFEVRKMEPAKDDPANTVHLRLSPKPDSQFSRQFAAIDVWVDFKENMPLRIQTLDKSESTVRTTDLSNVQVNPKLSDSDFALPKVSASDWQLIEGA